MNKFFAPLFSEHKRTYNYKLPLNKLRSLIEDVFHQSGGFFQNSDIHGKFTGANTFQMVAPSGAAVEISYRSTLRGFIKEHDGVTTVETIIRASTGIRILFWLSIVIGLSGLVTLLFVSNWGGWPGIIILIIGPLLTVGFANINNAVIEDRYRRYIHKHLITCSSTYL